jgi:F-type H+-transporting ATPase subunit delta
MKLNQEIDPSVEAITLFLKKRGQLSLLGKIIQRLQMLEKQQKTAIITSPVPLTPQEMDLAKRYLSKLGEPNLEIKNIVDESILSGLVIKIGDRVLDLSLKEQISKLREELQQ